MSNNGEASAARSATLGRDHSVSEKGLCRTPSHRRPTLARRLRSDGLAAPGRPLAHRTGHSRHGPFLRRAQPHDLSLALFRHGQHRPPRRRARPLYRRIHGSLRTHHQRQWRSDPPVAASLPLAYQDLFAGIHKSSGGDRKTKRRDRILVLERSQRLLEALRSHARNEVGQRRLERHSQILPRRRTAGNNSEGRSDFRIQHGRGYRSSVTVETLTLISGKPTSLRTIGRKAWVALRFVLFGLGGLWLLIIFSVEFLAGVRPQVDTTIFISPLLALPIALVGALMMLFAVGGWGQWAYLWVILSLPITVLLVGTVLPGDKGLATGLAIAVTASASHAAVRASYRHGTPTGDGQDQSSPRTQPTTTRSPTKPCRE